MPSILALLYDIKYFVELYYKTINLTMYGVRPAHLDSQMGSRRHTSRVLSVTFACSPVNVV